MDFSEVYRYSGPSPSFSPNGRFLASTADCRLIIRSAETLQVVQLYSCLDKVRDIQWCPNSLYVLCTLSKRPDVQIWSIRDPAFSCRIEAKAAGVQRAIWTQDAQSVIVVADFQIRLSIWSIIDSSCKHLPGPKFGDSGIDLTSNGTLMAVLERAQCKDRLAIYTCCDWQASRHALPTSDAVDVAWSPDATCLAVWESALDYRLLIVALDGRCLLDYCAYPDGLGIKTVTWAPSGQLLAIGSYDQRVRILDASTWEAIAELAHPLILDLQPDLVVYKEEQQRQSPKDKCKGGGKDGAGGGGVRSAYVLRDLPLDLTPLRVAPAEKPNPKIGIGRMVWSWDGGFLATKSDTLPNLVWVWDVTRLELASILQQAAAVRSLSWSPQGPGGRDPSGKDASDTPALPASTGGVPGGTLAVATEGPRVYLWSGEGASCVHIPFSTFCPSRVAWGPHGGSLLLTDRDSFCCAYLEPSTA